MSIIHRATTYQRMLQYKAFLDSLERNPQTGLLTWDSQDKRNQWLDLEGMKLANASRLLREFKNNPDLLTLEKIDSLHAQCCIDYLKKHGYTVFKRHKKISGFCDNATQAT